MHFGDFGPGGGHGRHGWEGAERSRQRSNQGQRRARRGNVRAAVLSLLNEQPMHGYQMIQELSHRSGGRWNPSPGSIYPTLQMLEDEGLVTSRQSEDGKRLFELTEAGRLEVARQTGASRHKPWEQAGSGESVPPRDLVIAIGDAAAALLAAAAAGNDEQRAQIVQLLSEFRQTLTAIVPEAGNAGPFAGRRRGPWGRSGPGWTFGVPDWIFGGGGPGSGRSPFDWGAWASGGGSATVTDVSEDAETEDEDEEMEDIGEDDDVEV